VQHPPRRALYQNRLRNRYSPKHLYTWLGRYIRPAVITFDTRGESPDLRMTQVIARPARISCQLIVIQELLLLLLLLGMAMVVVVVFWWIPQTVAERPARAAEDPAGKAEYCRTDQHQQEVQITNA